MLPFGFEWHPWPEGSWALKVIGRLAAQCVPVSNGLCRIETGIGLLSLHIPFQPSADRSRAFVEAWARKLESDIRAAYSAVVGPGWQATPGCREHTADEPPS